MTVPYRPTSQTFGPDSTDGPTAPPFYERLGVRRVINARGCATLAGGTLMDPAALRAFNDAASSFVLIAELQERVGEVIAAATGAEHGYVVSGAAAGLTLATAACIAGFDVDSMNRLPDTAGVACEVVIQRVHRNPYDHAIRAAGARLVEVEATAEAVRAAIGPDTAACFYHAEKEADGVSSATFVEMAHDGGVPVIVDASMSLPPASNLRRFVDEGADLVAFSGGKTIRGPQGAGFLAGRRDLLVSVALQHQDMDVLRSTWRERGLIEDGIIDHPPSHGIGRSMKVGKEEIAALGAAIERYVARDHAAEYDKWLATVEQLADGLANLAGVVAVVETPSGAERPVPFATLTIGPEARIDAIELVRQLADSDPRVIVNDYAVDDGLVRLNPENVSPTDASDVVAVIRSILADA